MENVTSPHQGAIHYCLFFELVKQLTSVNVWEMSKQDQLLLILFWVKRTFEEILGSEIARWQSQNWKLIQFLDYIMWKWQQFSKVVQFNIEAITMPLWRIQGTLETKKKKITINLACTHNSLLILIIEVNSAHRLAKKLCLYKSV